MTGTEWTRAIAIVAFVGCYVGLGIGRIPGLRVDRTGVAIIGAAVMVVSGAVPWTDAVAAVDAPTLALLFGMMIVTAYLRLSGFFSLVMMWALRRARTPLTLLAAVVVAAGTLSALFVNDVVCVVLTPVVLEATRQLGLAPAPYLLALATAANVGSVATLTGNPQNMLVGGFSGISYRAFLAYEAPVALFKPLIASFGEPRRAWLVLAMASTLAGNLTILGSVANLIVVETARAARVEIGFVEYCKVGVPLTLVTLSIGWILLALMPV